MTSRKTLYGNVTNIKDATKTAKTFEHIKPIKTKLIITNHTTTPYVYNQSKPLITPKKTNIKIKNIYLSKSSRSSNSSRSSRSSRSKSSRPCRSSRSKSSKSYGSKSNKIKKQGSKVLRDIDFDLRCPKKYGKKID